MRSYSTNRACPSLMVGIAMIALLTLAGCGSGSDQSTLTKKQFVQQGQAICRRGYKRQARWLKSFSKAHGFNWRELHQHEREVTNAAVALKVEREKIEELDALPVPAGDEAKIEEILESMELGVRESEKHPNWLAAPTAAHPEPFKEARALTGTYGIWVCGQA